MKKLALALALTAGGILGAGSASAAVVIIDHFAVGSGSISSGSLNIPGAGDAIGGSRTIAVTGGTGGTTVAVNSAPGTIGQYGHSQTVGTNGTSSVTWDSNGAGLGSADLVQGVNDALQLNVNTIDVGNVTLTFTVATNTGNGHLTLTGLNVGPHAFLFSSFILDSGTALNFANVSSISLAVVAGNNSDLALDLIQTREGTNVPVPGTLALLGLGLMGLRLRSRKAA